MSASVNDFFKKLGGASSIVNSPKVTSSRAGGVTTLAVDNCNWDQTTGKVFATYQVDTSNNVVAGTQTIWTGVVNSTTSIGSLTYVAGAADTGNAINDIVELLPASKWANDLMSGLLVSHNQDGTMITNLPLTTPKVTTGIKDANGATMNGYTATASAVNYVNDTNNTTGNDPIISAAGSDSTINLNLRGKGLAKTVTIGAGATTIFPYDYVVSGLVISGDSYASTLKWSITSGVVVINGNPITVAAQSANTATASKDTYVDVLDNGDGTGLLVYTGGNIVANNAASPALASNSIRLGIIVSGASSIAASTSINQGQVGRVLPIASSQPYEKTDSLGNLICPRDPNRKVLGRRQIVANVTTGCATSDQDVAGLAVPVIVPANRDVKITVAGGDYEQTGGIGTVYGAMKIKESTTGLANFGITPVTANFPNSINASCTVSPSTGSHTYKFSIANNSTGPNWTVGCSATAPGYILVELV